MKDSAIKDIRILDMVQRLSRAFEETFLDTLMPGILHNFANPLNSIMGRAQLLERRLGDTLSRIAATHPAVLADYREPLDKIVADVQSLCRETDQFCELFQDVSGKFSVLRSDITPEPIDLSRLLDTEMRFADSYLDFKHEVRKEVDLEDGLPEIEGVAAYYSLCFWSLFRSAMDRMRTTARKEFCLSTSHDKSRVIVRLRHGGRSLTDGERPSPPSIPSVDGGDAARDGEVPHVRLSLSLLQQMGAEIEFLEERDEQETVIRIPWGRRDEKSRPDRAV